MLIEPSQIPTAYKPLPESLHGSLNLQGGVYYFDYPFANPGLFRVPVVPGLFTIAIAGEGANPSMLCGLLARYSKPPGNFEFEDWNCVEESEGCPWKRDSTGSIERLRAQDWPVRNVGGHATIVWNVMEPVEEYGWFFVANVGFPLVHVVLKIDAATYDALDRFSWVGGNPPLVAPVPPVSVPSKKQQCTVKPTTAKLILLHEAGMAFKIVSKSETKTVFKVIR